MSSIRILFGTLILFLSVSHGQEGSDRFRYVDENDVVHEAAPDSVGLNTQPVLVPLRAVNPAPVAVPAKKTDSVTKVPTMVPVAIPDVPALPVESADTAESMETADTVEPVKAAETGEALERIPEDIQPMVADPVKMTRSELFQLAFKKPPAPRSRDFMARLMVDDIEFGDIQVLYDRSFTGFNFYSMRFSQYLDTLLSPEARKHTNGKDGHFNSQRMDSLGFSVGLDEQNYVLKIYVPPQFKQLQRTALGRRQESHGSLVDPPWFSLYTNFSLAQDARCTERLTYSGSDSASLFTDDPDQCDREPFYSDLEGAAAFQQWILEGTGRISEPAQGDDFSKRNMRRGDFRLLREFYRTSSRLSFGDVGGAADILNQYETVGGVRYEYNPRWFGHDIFKERYKIRFLLPRPAQVEVQIDGKTVYRLRLPSGSHELSGFSGHRGTNSIQVFMTQEDGSFAAIPYEYELGDARNLLKDEYRYSASLGMRRSGQVSGYTYSPEEWGGNASGLYGLASSLTAGVLGQGSPNNLLLGGQLLWSPDSSRWWEFRVAMNYADSTELGNREEISFSRKLELVTFTLLGRHQNHLFNPYLFGNVGTPYKERYGLTGSAGMSIPQGGVSVNAGVSFNREIIATNYSAVDYHYGISVSQNIKGLSLTGNASASVSQHKLEPFISLGASYNFGFGNHNFVVMDELARRPVYVPPAYTLAADSSLNSTVGEPEIVGTDGYTKFEWKNSSAVGWNWSDGGSINGAQSYSANLTVQDDFSYGRLWAQQFFNRGKVSASYNLTDYDASYLTMRSHLLTANAGVSFMFADGLWAFGRPVDKGFILAKPQNGLTGSSVHINHSDYYDADFSQSGWLGAAYYNQIANYRPNEIQISLTDVPMGSWLEQDRYYTMGAYKQGYAVRLGSAARVLMRVRLIDETKQPMDYVYVTVGQIDENGNMMEKRATFTSKDGVLQMGNLHPGHKYRIHFGADSYIKDIDVMVPRGSGSLFTLPDIQVEHKQLDMSMTKRSQASLGKPQPPASSVEEKPASLPLPMQVPAPAPPASANY